MAQDRCHDQVVRALEKDGWRVIRGPVTLYSDEKRPFVIDIEASNSGENGTKEQIVVIEVKCFSERSSFIAELQRALGQYILYRGVLNQRQYHSSLYLSVPKAVYEKSFDQTIRDILHANKIKLVIVDLEMEIIAEWIQQ